MNTTHPAPAAKPVRSVWFTTAKNGRRMAWEWGGRFGMIRAFRVPVADAEFWIATGEAVNIGGHPLKPR